MNKGARMLGHVFKRILIVRKKGQRVYQNPLLVNLEKVELAEPKPFVSIHVACYNEKRVIERLIRACAGQEWHQDLQGPIASGPVARSSHPTSSASSESFLNQSSNPGLRALDGTPSARATRSSATRSSATPRNDDSSKVANYEVILADDSTDETTEVVKQTLISADFKLIDSALRSSVCDADLRAYGADSVKGTGTDSKDEEIFVFTKPGAPTVKIIHRFYRDGFKGAALQRALEESDPRAEYFVILDADFVPYPDTIEQFVKAFQVLTPIEPIKTDYTDSVKSALNQSNQRGRIAAVQGYQWHVLNKSQNWVTRGVRTEYAGSYVIERAGEEIYGGLKQISGSVYMIRAEVLRAFGWGKSITEDFELTLRLYEAGYKVAFTPYIQVPAEAASTIKRLIRQRMRWAEGSSFNTKVMLPRLLRSPNMSRAEKAEFLYFAFYYLQAAFFVVGTLGWFISETIFHARVPFWTAALGWSLVFTNLLALPLMNIIGLFLEESQERDYVGIISFLALSYLLVPFQAYAALKGFIEKEEGPWFRTPKTGLITDTFGRSGFGKFFGGLLRKPAPIMPIQADFADFAKSAQFNDETVSVDENRQASGLFGGRLAPSFVMQNPIRPRYVRQLGNWALIFIVGVTVSFLVLAPLMPTREVLAAQEQLFRTMDSAKKSGEEQSSFMKEEEAFAKELENGKVAVAGQGGFDPENPPNKDEIIKKAQTETIGKQRLISKKTKDGRKIDFIFSKEPKVRIKLENQEVEFETKTVFGKRVDPTRATIYLDREVVYEEVIPNVDLKYTINGDLMAEEFILKAPIKPIIADLADSVKSALSIEQTVRTVDVKVVSPDPTAFGFYSESGEELFRFSSPFAKDNGGAVSNDISITLKKDYAGHKLTKTIEEPALAWLAEEARAYPVAIDPSVIVSGGITAAETQYGGLQRKVAFVNGNWYAFYNDGTDALAQKSSDGSTWAVLGNGSSDLDSTDADNFNPSIGVSGNFIFVAWIDNSLDGVEIKSIDTASSDTLTGLCSGADIGVVDATTHMVTIAPVSTTRAVVAFGDTSSGGTTLIFDVTNITGATCTPTYTDMTGGNVVYDSGFTAGDRGVVVPLSSGVVAMVFQDGNLSYSELDISAEEWAPNNLTIASVTDNVYSVTTDQATTPTVWILTANATDTTDTNFYTCCTEDFAEATVDSDVGSPTNPVSYEFDMFCPTEDNCKIVYTDDNNTTAPKAKFVDCNDATCSSPTITTFDSDIGASGDDGGLSIYCVDDGDTVVSDNCKVIYVDNLDTDNPDANFVDCTDDEDCSTNTITTVDTDIGSNNSVLHSSIWCPTDGNCKFLYNDSVDADLFFVDCPDATCTSTGRVITTIDASMSTLSQVDLYCVASDNCKFLFTDHGDAADDLTFSDCTGDEDCSTRTDTVVDSDVAGAGQEDNVPVALDCVGGDTDCKFIYADNNLADLFFVNCSSAVCDSQNTGSPTTFDAEGGTDLTAGDIGMARAGMACVSAIDCKFVYLRSGDDGDETMNIADCDDSGDSNCTSGSVITKQTAGGFSAAYRSEIQCLTSTNCKLIFLNSNAGLVFADCDVTNCFPSVTDDEDPWPAVAFNDIDTAVGADADVSVYCPTAADCKVVYGDDTDGDVTFADCNDADCDAPTINDIDTDVTGDADVSVYCPTADDCKVAYHDNTDLDVTFADCANAACSSFDGGGPLDIDTSAGGAGIGGISVYCPTATDCKVAYHDNGDGDITFADCGDAACSDVATGCNANPATSPCSDIDSAVGTTAKVSVYCPTAADCKVVYGDDTDGDVTFADCNDADCDAPTINDIDTAVGTTAKVSVYCSTATDCKVAYHDNGDGDITFADCGDAACSDVATGCNANPATSPCSDIDSAVGTTADVSVYCPTADDCKVVYGDGTDGDVTFADCGNAACSSFDGGGPLDIDTDVGTNVDVSVYCPTAADCKVVYGDDTDGDVTFADCVNAACAYSAIETVSLSYDSSNSDLYAHVIMDTSDQAYWKSSDAATVSWGSQTSYAFTAGTLNEISAPERGAGTGQIGVVLNQNTNFEFAPVPERYWVLLTTAPFWPGLMRKFRRRRKLMRM